MTAHLPSVIVLAAMYDNAEPGRMQLIATGHGTRTSEVLQPQVWQQLQQEYGHGE